MEKNWLKSYESNVPAEIDPDIYSSLVDVFQRSCKQYQNKIAMTNYGTSMTYGEWYLKSSYFAAFLQKELGAKKGDRFAIMLPNVMQYPVALMGAMLAGMTVVNVNPLYTVPELVHQLNDAGVHTVIVLSNFAKTLGQALPQLTVKHVIVSDIGDLFPFPKSWLMNFIVKYVKKKVKPWNIPQAISFNEVISLGKNLVLEPVPLKPNDIAFLQYTGGTTGISKGAVLTHRNMLANMQQAFYWVSNHLLPGQEVIITALPLYHIFALLANCLLFIKLGGTSVLITDPRNIPQFVNELKKTKFTAMTGVNTLFNALMNHPDFSHVDFSKMKLALSGGMATQHAVAEQWFKVTGKVLIEAYGLTEASPAVTVNPMNLKGFNGSIGLPLPSTDISIRDDDGKELPLGQAGELYVKGPQVMQGYWNNPNETKGVFTTDGWLRTGDIAVVDNEGFVRLVDRKKDIIIVSGFNVYPNEIEDIIAGHPGVQEVAVVGMPDKTSGEVVKAFIVKKDPALTQEDIINYCHQRLTNYKVPKQVEFRDTLPKTNVGKVLRRALRE